MRDEQNLAAAFLGRLLWDDRFRLLLVEPLMSRRDSDRDSARSHADSHADGVTRESR